MKKLVLVLLVAVLSVPAFAADPAITLTPGGTGKVDISYTSDGTDANLPSGFGLTVTVSGTATITAVTNLDSAYTIFPGQIDINDATGVVNSYGSPIANALDEPGTGINTNTVVLEFGALYARPAGAGKPAQNARLCTITVSANCTVTVTGNARRCGTGKGIVAQNLAAYPIDADNTLTLAVSLCTLDVNGNKADVSGYNNSWSSGIKDGKVDLLDFSFITYKNWWNKTCSTLTGTNQTNCVKADISGLNNSWSSGQPDGKVDLLDFTFLTYKNWWNKPTCR